MEGDAKARKRDCSETTLDDWGEVRLKRESQVGANYRWKKCAFAVRTFMPRRLRAASSTDAAAGSAGAGVAGVSGCKVAERHDANWRVWGSVAGQTGTTLEK